MEPSCILIGAQKGGTSAFYRYMSMHPAVAPTAVKEINFFNCESRYARGLDFYHSHFPPRTPWNQAKTTFDVTPGYLPNTQAASRIYEYDPDMKLITLLRDPVTRAFSAWQMYRRRYGENHDWFFDWMRMCDRSRGRESFVLRGPSFGECFEDDVVAELEVMEQGETIEMPILTHGLYCQQLETYLDFFSLDQILIIGSERFRNKTRFLVEEVEDFVGLPRHSWDEGDLEVYVGRYTHRVPLRAQEILTGFYAPHNQRLFSMLDRSFEWQGT